MLPTVRTLVETLGIPDTNIPETPWDSARDEIGTDFPADYREIVDIYGRITFDSFFSLVIPCLEPRRPGYPIGFPGFVNFTIDGVGEHLGAAFARGDFRENPYPIFPAPRGLLQWGQNHDLDCCFWITDGEPDQWPIAVWHRQAGKWAEFEGGVSDFLLSCLSGNLGFASLGIAPRAGTGAINWRRTGDWTGWKKYFVVRD